MIAQETTPAIVHRRLGIILLILSFLLILSRAGSQEPAKAEKPVSIQPPPQSIVFAAAFSPDGKQIALACEDRTISVHELATGKLLTRFQGHSQRVWKAAFSPDGRLLASGSGEYSTPNVPGEIIIWDLKTGKEKFSLLGHRGLVFDVIFSPDGKTLLSGSWDGTIKLWDVATGKEKETLGGHTSPVRRIAHSPDGKTFATASFDGTVRFWQTAAAKEQKVLKAHPEGVAAVAFTPDGKYLATCARTPPPNLPAEIILWNLATGKEQTRLGGFRGRILSIAFSPDGRMLAGGGGAPGQFGEVLVFEVASGQLRFPAKMYNEWIECVQFAPKGKMLAITGGFRRGVPGIAEIWPWWDSMTPTAQPLTKPTPAQQEKLWQDLGTTSAETAFLTASTLTASPQAAIDLFKSRLEPVAPPNREQIAQWIADLDHASFKRRELATKELRQVGDLAAAALRKLQAEAPSEEARQRAAKLLQGLDLPITNPDLLRGIRAIEVLEKVATPQARQLLHSLAKGAPEAQLTSEAKAALQRLTDH